MGSLTPHIMDQTSAKLQFDVRERRMKEQETIRYRDRTRTVITYGSTYRRFTLRFAGTPTEIDSLLDFLDANTTFYMDHKLLSQLDIKVALLDPDEGYEATYDSPGNGIVEIEVEEVP